MTALTRRFWSLHRGRSRKSLVCILPDDTSPLYRIDWPDAGLSNLTNLTRAKAAALEWAGQKTLTEGRNLSVAQRLKLLNNFSWSASPVRGIDSNGEIPLPTTRRISARLNGQAVGVL